MVNRLVWLAVAATVALQAGAAPLAQESFYGGKVIRIIVGTSPGGGFDTYSRTIARHLGKYIPGNPTVIVENMAGAGGLKALESGDAVVVLQITRRPHPDLPKVPVAITLAKTEEARQLIEAGVHAPSTIYRPYVAPPGTPKERVQLLRTAFQATLRDPEFVAEAQKARLTIDPVSGEELEQTVAGMFKLNPQLVAKLKEILFSK